MCIYVEVIYVLFLREFKDVEVTKTGDCCKLINVRTETVTKTIVATAHVDSNANR